MTEKRSIIGRREERAALHHLLDEVAAGHGGSIAIIGDAGLGKSALLDHLARECGPEVRVLRLTGVEVESDLAFAGLGTLISQAANAFEELDESMASILRGAIGLAERTPTGLEVNLATLSFLATLGAAGPVVVLIDDAQWVDRASLGILTFVARRLADDPVAVIVCSRPSAQVAPHLQGIPTVELEPLPLAHGVDLLAEQQVDPLVAAECWRLTGGNPLALLELAGVLDADQRRGRMPLPHAIPIADSIREAFDARMALVGPEERRVLAVAAVEASGDATVLARALEAAALDPALLEASALGGLLSTDGGVVHWDHPLARAAAIDALGPRERRAAHRAVAAALEAVDAGRLAFHLAAAADGPDESVAVRLDQVARLAEARGASSAAAEAWEAAAELSVDPGLRFERIDAGLTARWSLGESETVVRTGRPLVEATHDPHQRARLALSVGQAIVWWQGPIAGARYLSAEGDRVAASNPAAAGLLEVYAANAHLVALDPAAVIVGARRTAELAARAGDLGLPVMAGAMESLGRLLIGEASEGRALLGPLSQLGPALLEGQVDGAAPMAQVVAFAQLVDERWDEARDLLHALIAEAERTGYIGMQSYAHDQLSELEWRQGRWAEAASRVAHMATLAEGHDQPIIHQGRLRQARLDACRGRTTSARAVAEEAFEVGQSIGLRSLVIWAREVLVLAALADDDTAGALRHLDALSVVMADRQVRLPGLVWWQAHHIEALRAEGRTADARAALDRLRLEAEGSGARWADAAVARGEAALAPHPVEAVAHLDRAVALLAELGAGFELALALAARGNAHRAAGQEQDAVRDLAEAQARFEHLDARPWAERTATLLGTASAGVSSSVAARLTDAELRVALAVGSGLTNREAAGELFLSVKTVDSHLQSIYRRLEIRSRSQLAALVARELAPAG